MALGPAEKNRGVAWNRTVFFDHRILAACAVFSLSVLSLVSMKDGFTYYVRPRSPIVQDGIIEKTKVAYAVSITSCGGKDTHTFLDAASVLRHSIHVASKLSKYDYRMIAFVHPDAADCATPMTTIGYEAKIMDTPFNESQITNSELIDAQGATCCGFKEFLKLYSYLESSYPVVVHLDLDCLLLKPLDDLFDLMLDPSFDRAKIDAMWLEPGDFPEQIDFLFTRDYNMVEPYVRKPYQIGVQGGFMIFRPNATDFQRNINIITSEDGFRNFNWGDSLGYGGYYGASTIQGLASYYYGELAKNRSLELNRCYHDAMVDDPNGDFPDGKDGKKCRTLQEECQDCRLVNVTEIYSAHFTICGKPWWCNEPDDRLCRDLRIEWYRRRYELEEDWKRLYPTYVPDRSGTDLDDPFGFHCYKENYTPLRYPIEMNITIKG